MKVKQQQEEQKKIQEELAKKNEELLDQNAGKKMKIPVVKPPQNNLNQSIDPEVMKVCAQFCCCCCCIIFIVISKGT